MHPLYDVLGLKVIETDPRVLPKQTRKLAKVHGHFLLPALLAHPKQFIRQIQQTALLGR